MGFTGKMLQAEPGTEPVRSRCVLVPQGTVSVRMRDRDRCSGNVSPELNCEKLIQITFLLNG